MTHCNKATNKTKGDLKMENKERETNRTNDEQKEKVTNEQIMEMLNELRVDNFFNY